MKHIIKCRLTNVFLFIICLGFVAVTFLPAPGFAITSEFGIADMTWDYSTLMYTPSVGGAPVEVNWIDPADGVTDRRNSFSSAVVTLNGVQTDPGDSSFVEGAWALTGLSTSLTDPTGTAGASGLTQPTGGITRGAIQAISDISIGGVSSADVFAQGIFGGQFTVSSAGTLSITAPYLLSLILNSDPGGFSAGNVGVGLVLSDFDITDPATGQSLILASDIRSYANSINGLGSSTFIDQDFTNSLGPLALNFTLSPGITYDFEAFGATTASAAAAVPEPGTLLLLGSGLIGIATTVRKRFKKET